MEREKGREERGRKGENNREQEKGRGGEGRGRMRRREKDIFWVKSPTSRLSCEQGEHLLPRRRGRKRDPETMPGEE